MRPEADESLTPDRKPAPQSRRYPPPDFMTLTLCMTPAFRMRESSGSLLALNSATKARTDSSEERSNIMNVILPGTGGCVLCRTAAAVISSICMISAMAACALASERHAAVRCFVIYFRGFRRVRKQQNENRCPKKGARDGKQRLEKNARTQAEERLFKNMGHERPRELQDM